MAIKYLEREMNSLTALVLTEKHIYRRNIMYEDKNQINISKAEMKLRYMIKGDIPMMAQRFIHQGETDKGKELDRIGRDIEQIRVDKHLDVFSNGERTKRYKRILEIVYKNYPDENLKLEQTSEIVEKIIAEIQDVIEEFREEKQTTKAINEKEKMQRANNLENEKGEER